MRPAPASAFWPPGQTSAGVRSRCRSSSSSCSWPPPPASGPAGRSSTPSARSTPTRPRPSSTRAASRSTRPSPGSGPRSCIRAGRSSCRRCRTCTAPPASSSPGSGSRIAGVDWARRGRDGDRAVAVRGRLHAARRADRGAARCRLPRLPLRHRRRALRPAGDDRAGRAPVDRAVDPRGRRRARLPPDGRRPRPHFAELAESGGDSVTFHVEATDDAAGVAARRGSSGSGSGSRSSRKPRSRRRLPRRARPRPSSCSA